MVKLRDDRPTGQCLRINRCKMFKMVAATIIDLVIPYYRRLLFIVSHMMNSPSKFDVDRIFGSKDIVILKIRLSCKTPIRGVKSSISGIWWPQNPEFLGPNCRQGTSSCQDVSFEPLMAMVGNSVWAVCVTRNWKLKSTKKSHKRLRSHPIARTLRLGGSSPSLTWVLTLTTQWRMPTLFSIGSVFWFWRGFRKRFVTDPIQ